MRFLDRAEAAKTVRQFEWRSGKASPQITLFYTSGATDYGAAAGAITDALGAFGQATLICTDLPWGDFWNDDDKRWMSFMNGGSHSARPPDSTRSRGMRS